MPNIDLAQAPHAERPVVLSRLLGVPAADRSSLRARLAERIMAATLRHLERAVRDLMPPGVTRDFYGWALEPANPLREEFLASAGICQLTHMNTVLLDGLVDGVDLGNLTDRLGLMAAWQYFEVISDNLAIGLARRPPGDLNCNQRRRLVGRFNAAVIRRLQGDRAGAAEQLRALASGVGRISLFDQSLTAGKARRFAAAFASDGDGTVEELEQDVVPVLIVNMELVAECADRVRDPDLRAVTVAGLIARYAAVDRQLAGSARTPAELVRDGAETILVVPTMAYVIAAWIAASRSAVAVSALVRDGLLAGALFDAAAVIRLANDLGTGLVERSAADHEQLGRELLRADEHQGAGSFSERLARFSESSELLSRIRKDVVYGEFNLGLDNLAADQPVARSVERFVANLVHYSTLYQRRRRTLGEGLAEIVRRTGERRIGEVVERFVSFHERLYRHRFEAAEGEYAI